MRLYGLLGFYEEWFKGPLKLSYMIREVGYQIGPLKDPENRNTFRRSPFALEGFKLLLEEQSRKFRNLNIFLSIALYEDLDLSNPIYDALHYDFDSKENPSQAIKAAKEFATSIRKRFGCDSVLYLSGLHGAHVVVPLAKPTDWEGYQLLWRTLIAPYKYLSLYVDSNMLQHNRLDRIPCTWNIKNVKGRILRGFARLIDINERPLRCEEFSWENYQPLDPSSIEIMRFKARVEAPKLIVPRRKKTSNKQLLPYSIEELVESEAVPPCIRNVIEAMVKSGDIDHYQRLILVWYLKWVGFSVDQVVDFFRRHAKDFNEKITRYQVEYAYGLRGSRKDYLMPRCNWLKQHGICLNCGWNRNPVTYTYSRAQVPEEIKQRFFNTVKGGIGSYTAYQINSTTAGLGQATVTLSRIQTVELPDWLRAFLRDTGLREFTYDDLKQWFEGKDGVTAKQWHNIARTLRKLAEQGLLGRKFLVDGQWIDYGSRKIRAPPSKTVKFYVKGGTHG